MDLTPFLNRLQQSDLGDLLLTVSVTGKVALAMKGRLFLRSLCASFWDPSLIGCAVTDESSCLDDLARESNELLICTDFLDSGSGFELARKARERQADLKVVLLALGDAIPVEHLSCPRLTPREYEVLDLLARGLSDREMSQALVVTEETARTYTKRLLRTLDVNNRLQAVLKGMRCGMVNL
jgi:DNA-binding NarL/FixJ family response regulator